MKTNVLRRIPIEEVKRNHHPQIISDEKKLYLVKVDGKFALGTFDRQWYGLHFDGFYDAGLQFDEPGVNCSKWEEIYEFNPEFLSLKESAELAYDPINDEHREFTLGEWIAVLKAELDRYEKEFADTNEFHRQTHTWHSWLGTFIRYMSW